MDGEGEEDDQDSWTDNRYNVYSLTNEQDSPSNTQSAVVEMLGPKKYVALGANDLIIRYRLSPLSSSSSFSSPTHHHHNDVFIKEKENTSPPIKSKEAKGGYNTIQYVMYLSLEEGFNDWFQRRPNNNNSHNNNVGAEDGTLISMKILSYPPSTEWQEVCIFLKIWRINKIA